MNNAYFEDGLWSSCGIDINGNRIRKPQTIWSEDATLDTFTHYSSPKAKEVRTIFGKEEKGLFYNYSDHLWGWDYDKMERANKYAKLVASPNTAKYFKAMLSYFHDGAEVSLRHIMAGCNMSNGYDYLVYGYKYETKPEDTARLAKYDELLGKSHSNVDS